MDKIIIVSSASAEYIANAANISFLTAKDAKIILWHSKILDF